MTSLEDVVRVWATDPHDFVRRQSGGQQALDQIRLYRLEKNGLSIWRAYLALRRHGQPVWESILEHIDGWAVAIQDADGAEEIARALELLGSEKSPKGSKRLAGRERDWRIASAVWHARRDFKLGVYAAFNHVSKHGGYQLAPGLDVRSIKAAYYATFPARSRQK